MYYYYLHFKDDMAEPGEVEQLALMKPFVSSAPFYTDSGCWKEFVAAGVSISQGGREQSFLEYLPGTRHCVVPLHPSIVSAPS